MKKLLSIILAVCVVLILPTTTIVSAEQLQPPMLPDIETYRWGRFRFQVLTSAYLVGYDTDNSNVGGVIDPNAYNAYDTPYTGEIVIPETVMKKQSTTQSGLASSWSEFAITNIDIAFFYDVQDLKKLTLSNNLNTLASPNYYCPSLEEIIAPEGNPFFSSKDGVLYNKDKTVLEYYPRAKGNVFSVPEGVTEISQYAFFNNSIEKLTLPETLVSVDDYAFSGCTSLTDINIPKNLVSVGRDSFANTPYWNDQNNWENGALYLEHILLKAPDNVSSFTVKDGTRAVGGFAFYYNKALTELSLPYKLEALGSYCFAFCSNLTTFNFPPSLWYIGTGALNYTSINNIVLPDTIKWIGTNALPSYYYHAAPADENGLVYNGRHLLDVRGEIEGVVKVRSDTLTVSPEAFMNQENITEIVLPEGLVFLGSNAFINDTNLKYIHFPSTLEYIGEKLFYPYYIKGNTLTHKTAIGQKDSYAFKKLQTMPFIKGFMTISESDSGVTIEDYNAYSDVITGEVTVPLKLNNKFVSAISDQAKAKMDNIVISGYVNSFAEQFAKENDIPLAKKYWYGDLTGDFEVKADDALLILQKVVSKVRFNEDQNRLADVIGEDNLVNAKDALAILQMAVGKIKEF